MCMYIESVMPDLAHLAKQFVLMHFDDIYSYNSKYGKILWDASLNISWVFGTSLNVFVPSSHFMFNLISFLWWGQRSNDFFIRLLYTSVFRCHMFCCPNGGERYGWWLKKMQRFFFGYRFSSKLYSEYIFF